MKERITNNLALKLISLFIAIVVWFVIINIEDPTTSKNISGIAVTVINENAISEAGKCYVIDSDGTVDIRVKGPKSVIDKIQPSDFTAIADLSKYSITNTVPVSVEFTSDRNFSMEPEIVYGKNNNINIILDDFVTREYNISLDVVGNESDGYYVSKEQINMDSEKVKISGPETIIKSIHRVGIDVDISDIKDETFVLSKIKTEDKYGKIIDSDRLTFNRDIINVTVNPLIKKEVPIKVVIKGSPAEEYSVNNADSDITSIQVVGDKSSVEAINIIDLIIDVNKQKKTIKKRFDLSKFISSTVKMISNNKVANVEVTFKKNITREISFKAKDIEFKNIQAGYLNKFDNEKKLNIKIKGLEQYVSNITIAELKPFIDLKLMKVGKHKAKVMFDNTSNVTFIKDAYLEIDIKDSKEVGGKSQDTTANGENDNLE